MFLSLIIGTGTDVTSPADSLRKVGVRVLDRHNRPVEGVIMYSTADCKPLQTDAGGRTILPLITDGDSLIAILPEAGIHHIPLEGMDSILIKVRSGKRFKVYPNARDDRNTPHTTLDNIPALLEKRSVSRLSDLLQGLVPGLNIGMDSNGEATSTIRGVHSINLSSEPLVMVDGVEIGTLKDADSAVDIHTVQSIEIDKDGSMYGMRGANGVIKIRTIGYGGYTY